MDEYYSKDNMMISNSAFETVVLTVLNDYAFSKSKKILRQSLIASDSFDAYLPDGLTDNIPTYIEIKYYRDREQLIHAILNNFRHHAAKVNFKYLFVITPSLPENEKEDIERLIYLSTNIRISVLDFDDFKNMLGMEVEGDSQKLESPERIIVRRAINNTDSEQQKAEQHKNLIQKLKEKYHTGEVVLVLGAGVSMSSGIPGWESLVSYLLYGMIQRLLVDKKAIMSMNQSEILKMASDDARRMNPLLLMRYIRTALEPKEYNLLIKEALYVDKPLPDSPLYRSICNLCRPSRRRKGVDSIITYNFDDLLETILAQYDIEFTTIFRESDERSNEVLNIFHVDGYLPRSIDDLSTDRGLVFSEEDYHHIYSDAYCWSNIHQINSFRDKTCLFIGSSITDPNMRRLLDVASRHDEKPRHFAFMLRPHVEETTNEASTEALSQYKEIDERIWRSFYQALGINVIWVDTYEEIPVIIDSLITK